ncbi:ADP-ribose pyrophosphatase [Motilibacter rhizosphaerae]|uniref:ADP-ribose pyrophosphatase n=1 Tax=Motilibacter rhizosphaerae TaxID=598652 RepID=A0A4Q7NGK8_9ACTN|nr:NUDIX hydrolase [Motilibacter rhizosphaerae]RZS82949.1 ADP-ribose pyrophosphatase [Motilibacter rhizosphaerae]
MPEQQEHAEHVVRSEPVYDGPKVGVRRAVVPDGGEERAYDVLAHPGGVAVVALREDRQVLLVEQFRPAVEQRLWQLPMGFQDREGEPPEQAARRELHEETGWSAERWRHLRTVAPAAGVSEERTELYLATGLAPGEAEREDDEQGMEQRWVALDEAVDDAVAGRLLCGTTSLALLLVAELLRRDGGSVA